MQQYCLEIACFTLEGALLAQQAGAYRIELCENPSDGGTTASYGMLKKVKDLISIPVFPIIRPRGGDFVYSNQEFDVMKYDIEICKQLGYEGVVFGILNEEGDVDIERTDELVKLASPMQVTFHRAFDRSSNPLKALEDIIQCGCHRILSSGQFPSVIDGLPLLKQLILQANKRIIIMPGSGLNSMNVIDIATATGAFEFHTAARKKITRSEIVSPSSMNETLSFISVDQEEIKNINLALDSIFQ